MDVDLLVLGTGTAGQRPAQRCREAGWEVAMVESGSPGGTCSQFGCDAKKPLVDAASAVAAARAHAGMGVKSTGLGIDWGELIAFKRTFTAPIAQRTREKLSKLGVTLIEGSPRFTGRNSVSAAGRDFRAGRILIATGLRARALEIPGKEHLTSSRAFLDLDVLPRRVIFVGGGYISFELGHAAAVAGARVTIIQADDCPLARFDGDMVTVLLEASRDLGVTVLLEKPVESIEKHGNELIVTCAGGTCRERTDMAVLGAGRVPSLDGLELERGDVEYSEDGILVNEYLQSRSNPAVYAAGDVAATGAPALTPVSSLEAGAVGENLLNCNRATVDYRAVPTTAFTIPPIAGVGLTEKQAGDTGLKFEVRIESLAETKLLKQTGTRHGACKMIIDKRERRLLGAHYVGSHAEEIINIFALAIREGISVDSLKETLFTYPSLASLLKGIL